MTKPFDLERAIAGDPVQTRDGQPVVWGGYNPDARTAKILGWINGLTCDWQEDGKYLEGEIHPNDLVMAPKKQRREVWQNWYIGENGRPSAGVCRYTVEASKETRANDCIATTCTIVEWEE